MQPTRQHRSVTVWFYIGTLLALYGVLLTAAGVYQWLHPPATVLAQKHATFWAGVLLLVIGGTYTILYWPRPDNRSMHDGSRVE